MEYVVFKTGGKQYRATVGDVLDVDRIPDAKDKIIIDSVLLQVADSDIKIGKPYLSGAKISAKVLGEKRGEKIRVAKYKAKVRYRKVNGFRAMLTTIKIEDIEGFKKAKPAPKEKAKLPRKTKK
ncbi:MAG: 50S ribosomal protein L21 [Candidatus Levybacteria bacterium]|nr:50S ribosomal protein L21 [Candidatus Levybacteria bacterium]MBI2420543.1 50S ribosomal protein L21 [Candidatus Levybacteria bacterium]